MNGSDFRMNESDWRMNGSDYRMNRSSRAISGIWLPVITPFLDGRVDLPSYERLLAHYLAAGVAGVFPLGTTGESPTLDEDEMEAIVERPSTSRRGVCPSSWAWAAMPRRRW